MFRGLNTFFNNLNVGAKLAVGFGTLVFLTLLVGSVSLIASQIEGAALEEIELLDAKILAAERLEEQLLASEVNTFKFIQEVPADYDVAFLNITAAQANIATAQSLIEELGVLADQEPLTQEQFEADDIFFASLTESVTNYETNLLEVTSEDFQTLGNETFGLIQRLEVDFAAIDEAAVAAGDFEVAVADLMQRLKH